MAEYDSKRLSVNAGGKTGAGVVAMYDASGADAVGNRQGGAAYAASPTSANVNGDGYFPRTRTVSNREVVTEIGALVEEAHTFLKLDEPHGIDSEYGEGTGVPILLKANNRLLWDVLYRDGADLKLRGGNFRID